jgi:hypothetical protein
MEELYSVFIKKIAQSNRDNKFLENPIYFHHDEAAQGKKSIFCKEHVPKFWLSQPLVEIIDPNKEKMECEDCTDSIPDETK